MPRAIEVGFPIVEINRLAQPERNGFKPIYQMHKWFARRASCVFRAILLGALKPAYKEDGTPTDLMAEFYKDHSRDPDTQPFHFPRGHKILVEGIENVLIAAGENRDDVASYIHGLMASRANDLQRMSGFVQLVFERRLSQASDFWFDVGLERVSLRRIFDSPKKQVDRSGNEFFTVGFNLT
ncbi:MAG: DUF1156 domain-containing protein [Gammaproteobacteria bacterium]